LTALLTLYKKLVGYAKTAAGQPANCAKLAEEVASLTASCSALNKRMEVGQLEKETLTNPAALFR